MIFVKPKNDIWLTASNDVPHIISCRPHAEVAMRHVECPDEIGTQFNVLFSTFAIPIVFCFPTPDVIALRGVKYALKFY